MAVRKTLSFTPYLFKAMEILRKRNTYRNMSEYVVGLVRYHAQTQGAHTLSGEWVVLTTDEKCLLDAAFLAKVESGVGIEGAEIEERITQFVQAQFDAGKPEPTSKDVALHLARSIGDDALKAGLGEKQTVEREGIWFSDDLLEAAELLKKREKYRSLSEYIQGLARYDAQSQKPHAFSAEWAAFSPTERDQLDASLLKGVKEGTKGRGSWLPARIYDLIMKVYRPAEYEAEKAARAEAKKKAA